MNQECSIVRDLLPLYAERLTSPETAAFVEKHLRTCADCRAALQETQAPPALQPAPDAAPLQHLQKRLARKRLQIIVMTALFVLTAVISAAGILNAPIYFPYTDDLVQVTEDAGALELTFRADGRQRLDGALCRSGRSVARDLPCGGLVDALGALVLRPAYTGRPARGGGR